MAGNHYHVKPSIGGRQDAGYGLHMIYDLESGFKTLNLQESGFFTEGIGRAVNAVEIGGEMYYLVGKNNAAPELFSFTERKHNIEIQINK